MPLSTSSIFTQPKMALTFFPTNHTQLPRFDLMSMYCHLYALCLAGNHLSVEISQDLRTRPLEHAPRGKEQQHRTRQPPPLPWRPELKRQRLSLRIELPFEHAPRGNQQQLPERQPPPLTWRKPPELKRQRLSLRIELPELRRQR